MRKAFLVLSLLLLSFIAYFVVHSIVFSDKRLHIVFCDVGQGDAILIRSPSGIVSLVDAGPDEMVLDCLTRHLPFWERSVSLLLLSHPHTDHYIGMLGVLDRYGVKRFATENLNNETVLFRALLERLTAHKLPVKHLYAGDVFRFNDGVRLEVLGPTTSYLAKTSPGGQIGERSEFASLIVLVTYGEFSALLTGDSQASGVEEAMRRLKQPSISVLHVPHHGSKTGLNEAILERLKPEIAVISVGKNSYGHPSLFITELLRAKGVEQRETIKNGDIEVVTDGKKFLLR